MQKQTLKCMSVGLYGKIYPVLILGIWKVVWWWLRRQISDGVYDTENKSISGIISQPNISVKNEYF